jgi:NAD(P) transhydrogenase
MAYDYELLSIGCGPAGQRAAIQTAKLGRRVAVVERPNHVGGVCTNTGTVPSKTLRAAALDLTGLLQKDMYGDAYRVKTQITIEDLFWRTRRVIDRETEVIRDQLSRNHVDLLTGTARFIDEHTLDLGPEGGNRRVTAEHIVIAVGTTPVQPPDVEFDGRTVLDSDSILQLERIPATMTVVGAGVIGIEYASVFAAIGVRVTVIERLARLLSFVDAEIIEALQYHLRELRVSLRFSETVTAVTKNDDGRIITQLASGKLIPSDAVLYAAGRQGATESLELENAGLQADPRGRIEVNESYQTAKPHIYAVGDVIGFPSLASTSMEQGRLSACHAFGIEASSVPELFPYGIYSIPEISMVGRTEDELTEAGVPYEVGKANYREIARGQIIGDTTGLLKLIFHLDTHALLGVHIIGEGASELVHIGQAVLTFGGAIEYFVNTVFNYPTLAECYKTAAFDGINRLGVAPHEGLALTAQPGAATAVR